MTILITVFIISSSWLAKNYFGSELAQTLIIVLCIWFFVRMLISMIRTIFKGFKDMPSYSSIGLTRGIITIFLIIIATIILEKGLVSVAWSYTIGSITTLLIFGFYLWKKQPKLVKSNWNLDLTLGKKLLLFGMPLLLVGLTISTVKQVDTLIIMIFHPAETVGLYEVAKPITRLITYLGSAIAIPLLPMISELWVENQKEKLKTITKKISKYSFVLMIFPVTILLAFPEQIINLLFTSEYVAAAPSVRILTIGMVFFIGISHYGSILTGIEEKKGILISGISIAVFNLTANFLLIPYFGITGAATATTLSLFIGFCIGCYYVKNKINFSFPSKEIVKTLIGGSASLAFIWIFYHLLSPISPSKIIFILITAGIFYFVFILKTNTINELDLKIIEKSTPVPKKIINLARKLTKNSNDKSQENE